MKYQMENQTEQAKLNLRFSSIQLDTSDDSSSLVHVVVGVEQCADVLQLNSDDVLLCILPKTPKDDLGLRIQQKLIAAFCVENDIDFLDVDDDVTQISATLARFPVINKNRNHVTGDWGEQHGCVLVCRADKQDVQDG